MVKPCTTQQRRLQMSHPEKHGEGLVEEWLFRLELAQTDLKQVTYPPPPLPPQFNRNLLLANIRCSKSTATNKSNKKLKNCIDVLWIVLHSCCVALNIQVHVCIIKDNAVSRDNVAHFFVIMLKGTMETTSNLILFERLSTSLTVSLIRPYRGIGVWRTDFKLPTFLFQTTSLK